MKLPGIVIDHKLKISHKISRSIGILSKVKHFIDCNIMYIFILCNYGIKVQESHPTVIMEVTKTSHKNNS